MPAYTVLEGEILQSITWTIISWNLHLSGRGQTIKWPVGIDRPAKRQVKKTENHERWSKEGDEGQVTSGHVGQSEDRGFHILWIYSHWRVRIRGEKPSDWAHTRSLWLLSWKSNEGKQSHKQEAITKIRWNTMMAWVRGVAKVGTSGQKILEIFWR